MSDAVGKNQVSYPTLSDLSYAKCVDFFKVFQAPRCNFMKVGTVSQEMDHVVKKQTFYARGAISSANRYNIPARIDQKLCRLPQNYAYLQMAPDISVHTSKDDVSYSSSHCVVTLTCLAGNGTNVKIVLSTLCAAPKVTSSAIHVPMRLRRWSTIAIDMKNLVDRCLPGSGGYRAFLQLEVSATSAVRGLFLSPKRFNPYDIDNTLHLPPPQGLPALPPNLINYYDWLEVGFEEVKTQEIKNSLKKNVSRPENYAVLLEKTPDDFPEAKEAYIKQQEQLEALQKRRNEAINSLRQNNQKESRLKSELSTYRLADTIPGSQKRQEEQPEPPKKKPGVYYQPKRKQKIPEAVNQDENALNQENVDLKNVNEIDGMKIGTEGEETDDQEFIEGKKRIEEDERLTASEKEALIEAAKKGKQELKDNFAKINARLFGVQIVKKRFSPEWMSQFWGLSSAFISDGKVQLQTFTKRIGDVTRRSALCVNKILSCEQNLGEFQPSNGHGGDKTVSFELNKFKSEDLNILRIQVCGYINTFTGTKLLNVQGEKIVINAVKAKHPDGVINLRNVMGAQGPILLLNHKHVASVFYSYSGQQIVISADYVKKSMIENICYFEVQQELNQANKDTYDDEIDLKGTLGIQDEEQAEYNEQKKIFESLALTIQYQGSQSKQEIQQTVQLVNKLRTYVPLVTPSEVQLIGANEERNMFVVVFTTFFCVFEYTLLNQKEMDLLHTKENLYLKLLGFQLTEITGITHFESCLFNEDKLIFVGTNKGKSTLNLSIFDTSSLINQSRWIQIEQTEEHIKQNLFKHRVISVLSAPHNLESRHNQQIHCPIYKIIQISNNQFLTISSRQIRMIRIKSDSVKFLVVPVDFVQEEIQLTQQFKQNLMKKLENVTVSQQFVKLLGQACQLVIQNQLISDAGLVPDSHQKLYLLLNNNNLVFLNLQQLLTSSEQKSQSFILHSFIPVSYIQMFDQNRVISVDISGKVLLHQFSEDMNDVQWLPPDVTFNTAIVQLDKARGPSTVPETLRLMSSNIMGQSDDGEGKHGKQAGDSQSVEFLVMQDLGEYGIVVLHSGSDDAARYSTVFQTVMGNVQDVQFDPVHSSELAVVSADTLSVFDGFTRKTIITLSADKPETNDSKLPQNSVVNPGLLNAGNPYVPGRSRSEPSGAIARASATSSGAGQAGPWGIYSQAAAGFPSPFYQETQNRIVYSPKKYVIACYMKSTGQFSLIDLLESESFYLSKQVFPEPVGVVNMKFTKGGDFLVISSSTGGIAFYETKDTVQYSFSSVQKLISLDTVQLQQQNGSKIDVIIGIRLDGAAVVQTLPSLKKGGEFRILGADRLNGTYWEQNDMKDGQNDQQKPPKPKISSLARRVVDRRNGVEYIAEAQLECSEYYRGQLKHIREILEEARCGSGRCGNDSILSQFNVALIRLTQLRPDVNITGPIYLGRRCLNIFGSTCIAGILIVLAADRYLLANSNDKGLNQVIQCINLELFELETGKSISSVCLQSILTDFNDQDIFRTFLVQNKVYGTFLYALSVHNETFIQSINCLTSKPEIEKARVQHLPFAVTGIQQSFDGSFVSISSNQQSLYIFSWDCSDYGRGESQLSELNDQVMSLRANALAASAASSGNTFQVFVGSRSDWGSADM